MKNVERRLEALERVAAEAESMTIIISRRAPGGSASVSEVIRHMPGGGCEHLKRLPTENEQAFLKRAGVKKGK